MSKESEPCDCESGFCNRLPNIDLLRDLLKETVEPLSEDEK